MKNLLTLAILLSGLLIALPATANAGTLYVDDKGHCGGNTPCFHNIQNAIQNAIDAATAGDTVYVYEGTYNEDITLKSGVIVQGAGAEVTTIHGTGSASVVTATDVDSNAKIDGFTITGGSGVGGGGISLTNSSPTISNNIISDNYSSYVGGGIGCLFYGSNPKIINNIISNNTALWHGGGIGCYQAFAKIINNIISNNTTLGYNGEYVGYGGGIGIVTYSVVIITNNTIVNNTATQQGGAIGNKDSWATLTNNIISSNIQGGIRHDVRHDEINIPNITIDYNDVWGNSEYQYLNCSAGEHDISQDPKFVNALIGDYHLQGSSPCIDAGTNDAPALPDTDLDGNPRVVDGDGDGVAVVDMGAFEFLRVEIDITPGSDPNSINLKSKGVIPVAILTTDTFDTTTLDLNTVLFGETGTEAAPVQSALEDVDGDGDTDMILHFNTQDTGIACGDTSASLTGTTFNGIQIEGSDSIKTVSCK